jgi:hypothetical protein
MNSILCFNEKPCPWRKEFMDHHVDASSPKGKPYYRCGAKSLEHMRTCIVDEDEDIRKHGMKIMVGDEKGVKAWDPEKVILQRTDRPQQIDGSDKFEV